MTQDLVAAEAAFQAMLLATARRRAEDASRAASAAEQTRAAELFGRALELFPDWARGWRTLGDFGVPIGEVASPPTAPIGRLTETETAQGAERAAEEEESAKGLVFHASSSPQVTKNQQGDREAEAVVQEASPREERPLPAAPALVHLSVDPVSWLAWEFAPQTRRCASSVCVVDGLAPPNGSITAYLTSFGGRPNQVLQR